MRHCPHCGLEVYHTDGCSSVYCGRDASDKGNNATSATCLGCGEQFNWDTARHYKAKVTACEPRITDLDASDLDAAEVGHPAAAAPVPTVPDGACVRAPATIIK